MGRGRAKAKQTKVARQLKYHTDGTDLDRLRAELTANGDGDGSVSVDPDELEDEDDPYAAEDDEDGRAT